MADLAMARHYWIQRKVQEAAKVAEKLGMLLTTGEEGFITKVVARRPTKAQYLTMPPTNKSASQSLLQRDIYAWEAHVLPIRHGEIEFMIYQMPITVKKLR